MNERTIVLQAGEGETLRVVGDRIRVLAESAPATGGAELFEVEGTRGSGPPPHRHGWSEAYFCLSGELDVIVGDDCRRLRAGGYLQIPGDALHTYRVASERATFLAMTAPGGALAFFREMDRELRGADHASAPGRAIGVCSTHGVRIELPGPV